jgi:hypothetical protein
MIVAIPATVLINPTNAPTNMRTDIISTEYSGVVDKYVPICSNIDLRGKLTLFLPFCPIFYLADYLFLYGIIKYYEQKEKKYE